MTLVTHFFSLETYLDISLWSIIVIQLNNVINCERLLIVKSS